MSLKNASILSIHPASPSNVVNEASMIDSLCRTNPRFGQLIAAKKLFANDLVMVPCNMSRANQKPSSASTRLSKILHHTGVSINPVTATPTPPNLFRPLFFTQENLKSGSILEPIDGLLYVIFYFI